MMSCSTVSGVECTLVAAGRGVKGRGGKGVTEFQARKMLAGTAAQGV